MSAETTETTPEETTPEETVTARRVLNQPGTVAVLIATGSAALIPYFVTHWTTGEWVLPLLLMPVVVWVVAFTARMLIAFHSL